MTPIFKMYTYSTIYLLFTSSLLSTPLFSRAQKRMNNEDVFGYKISTSLEMEPHPPSHPNSRGSHSNFQNLVGPALGQSYPPLSQKPPNQVPSPKRTPPLRRPVATPPVTLSEINDKFCELLRASPDRSLPFGLVWGCMCLAGGKGVLVVPSFPPPPPPLNLVWPLPLGITMHYITLLFLLGYDDIFVYYVFI